VRSKSELSFDEHMNASYCCIPDLICHMGQSPAHANETVMMLKTCLAPAPLSLGAGG